MRCRVLHASRNPDNLVLAAPTRRRGQCRERLARMPARWGSRFASKLRFLHKTRPECIRIPQWCSCRAVCQHRHLRPFARHSSRRLRMAEEAYRALGFAQRSWQRRSRRRSAADRRPACGRSSASHTTQMRASAGMQVAKSRRNAYGLATGRTRAVLEQRRLPHDSAHKATYTG